MSEKYNGWANYPTWAVHLWLTNEEGLYDESRELVQREYAYLSEREDALKEFVEELCPASEEASVQSDLLGWALSQVDWREIAEALADDHA